MNRIEELLDTMEQYVVNCKTQTFSSTRIICEREALLEMVRELRARMPEELTRVQKIMANQDAILNNAREKANGMIHEAAERADQMVMEHQITKEAQAKANEIMKQATEHANRTMRDAIEEATNLRIRAVNFTDGKVAELQSFIEDAFRKEKEDSHRLLTEYRTQLEKLHANRQDLQRQLAKMTGAEAEAPMEGGFEEGTQDDGQGIEGVEEIK